MAWGALIYGYAAKADDIVTMPRVDSYRDKSGRIILIDNEDLHPLEWAVEHYKYGQYVHAEDDTLWYSDRVIFGIFVGESGDELNIEDMEMAKFHAEEIAEAVKFFCNVDVDISDLGYHIVTIYD